MKAPWIALAIFAAVMFMLFGSHCYAAEQPVVPVVGGVALEFRQKILYFVLIFADGDHRIVSVDDCAANPKCVNVITQMINADKLDRVNVTQDETI